MLENPVLEYLLPGIPKRSVKNTLVTMLLQGAYAGLSEPFLLFCNILTLAWFGGWLLSQSHLPTTTQLQGKFGKGGGSNPLFLMKSFHFDQRHGGQHKSSWTPRLLLDNSLQGGAA